MRFQTFLNNGYQDIHGDSNPDLCFDCVLGRSIKGFDSQVLLDPFEEQFHLPAAFVELSNGHGRKGEIIGEEDEPLFCFGIDVPDTSEFFWKVLERIETGDGDDLIGLHPSGFVHGLGVQAFENEVALGSGNKERMRLMDFVETGEVHIGPIHDVDGSCLDKKIVEEMNVVNFALCYVDNHGDVAPEVQKGMELDRCLLFAKPCPREDRKTQIDNRCIEGVDGLVEFRPEVLVDVQCSCGLNERLSEISIDFPVAGFVGMGQCISGDFATNSHVVEFGFRGTHTRFDIPKTFPVSQLGKGHTEELIPTGKALYFVIAVIALHALVERVGWKKIHQLGKNRFSDIHRPSPFAWVRKYGQSGKISSNRKTTFLEKTQCSYRY